MSVAATAKPPLPVEERRAPPRRRPRPRVVAEGVRGELLEEAPLVLRGGGRRRRAWLEGHADDVVVLAVRASWIVASRRVDEDGPRDVLLAVERGQDALHGGLDRGAQDLLVEQLAAPPRLLLQAPPILNPGCVEHHEVERLSMALWRLLLQGGVVHARELELDADGRQVLRRGRAAPELMPRWERGRGLVHVSRKRLHHFAARGQQRNGGRPREVPIRSRPGGAKRPPQAAARPLLRARRPRPVVRGLLGGQPVVLRRAAANLELARPVPLQELQLRAHLALHAGQGLLEELVALVGVRQELLYGLVAQGTLPVRAGHGLLRVPDPDVPVAPEQGARQRELRSEGLAVELCLQLCPLRVQCGQPARATLVPLDGLQPHHVLLACLGYPAATEGEFLVHRLWLRLLLLVRCRGHCFPRRLLIRFGALAQEVTQCFQPHIRLLGGKT
mmetsp:Transcript_4314/g.11102  ORF Transcript_4314/g.11102 Transcript_4314/m.11102 type:complete len:446 (+) Transcript_4314:654-1991(+)